MNIADFTFYAIDRNLKRRNALVRLLSAHARTVPLEGVSEVGSLVAENSCFLVYDEGSQLRECLTDDTVQNTSASVLGYSESPDVGRVCAVLDFGVGGYFEFDTDDGDPAEQISQLLYRDAKSQELRRRRQTAGRRLKALSPREHQVLRAVSEGQSNKAIARELSVSPRTVEIHRRNMIAKLDVSCSIAAVRVALEAEL